MTSATTNGPSYNPFIHPAQQRFQELLDEAEEQVLDELEVTGTLADPFRRHHVAEEWGVDPWVNCIIEAHQYLAVLQDLAVGVSPEPEMVHEALMAVSTKSLQALVLFEESQNSDATLDDQQLANFLDRLVDQLDTRIAKLRRPEPDQDDGLTEDQRPDGDDLPEDHIGHQHFAWAENVGPEPSPARTRLVKDEEADPWSTPEVAKRSKEFLDEDTGPMSKEEIAEAAGWDQVQEVPVDQAGHDFRPEEATGVDLDQAERGLAREVVALRQTAAGSSAVQLGGRHSSPDPTDPGEVKEGKH